jgi:hypothetical protein
MFRVILLARCINIGVSKDNTRISVLVSNKLKAKLEQIAKTEDRSVSYIASRILKEWEKNNVEPD